MAFDCKLLSFANDPGTGDLLVQFRVLELAEPQELRIPRHDRHALRVVLDMGPERVLADHEYAPGAMSRICEKLATPTPEDRNGEE